MDNSSNPALGLVGFSGSSDQSPSPPSCCVGAAGFSKGRSASSTAAFFPCSTPAPTSSFMPQSALSNVPPSRSSPSQDLIFVKIDIPHATEDSTNPSCTALHPRLSCRRRTTRKAVATYSARENSDSEDRVTEAARMHVLDHRSQRLYAPFLEL